MSTMLTITLLEEVACLQSQILANEQNLPYAYLAPQYAASAIHTLETALVENDFTVICPTSLVFLRKIAEIHVHRQISDAVESGDAVFVALLLDAGADIGNDEFLRACELGFTDIVRLLLELPLERGIYPGDKNNYALLNACTLGFTDIVRLLLELPLERGISAHLQPLYIAIRKGHTEIVQLLINDRIARGLRIPLQTTLIIACDNNHVTIVRLILNLLRKQPIVRGAERDELWYAIYNGNAEIVRLLLNYYLECEISVADDISAMFNLVCTHRRHRHHLGIIRQLLDYGVNPKYISIERCNAYLDGNLKLVELLDEYVEAKSVGGLSSVVVPTILCALAITVFF